eukprot:RCo015820
MGGVRKECSPKAYRRGGIGGGLLAGLLWKSPAFFPFFLLRDESSFSKRSCKLTAGGQSSERLGLQSEFRGPLSFVGATPLSFKGVLSAKGSIASVHFCAFLPCAHVL